MATQLIEAAGTHTLLARVEGRRARLLDGERPIDAVVRSIARRTRTVCCCGPSLASVSIGNENGVWNCYEATFGVRRKDDPKSYKVEGTLWIYV